jgi:aminoglycoside phosphotransferase (APT) family kinase protein
MSETEEMAGRLRAWLINELDDDSVQIINLSRTSVGYSRENWVFDAAWRTGNGTFIARRDPKGSVLETDRRIEAGVLARLEKSGLPTPRMRWVDVEGHRLGRPAIVMDCPAAGRHRLAGARLGDRASWRSGRGYRLGPEPAPRR